MSSKTKIVVLRSKELVYALVLIVISVLIIMTALSLFVPQSENADKRKSNAESSEQEAESIAPQSFDDASPVHYIPGIYSSEIRLGSTNAELQITVDAQHINSITLTNLDESIYTLYPLMQPTLDGIASKIIESQSLEGISCTGENRYTSMLLMQAIRSTLDKAVDTENADSPGIGAIY